MSTEPLSGRRRPLDLYEVLEVSPRASHDVIHAAFRVLARRYHPDVSSDPFAERGMRQVNASYNVLGNPSRRMKYDALRAERLRRETPLHRRASPGRPATTAAATPPPRRSATAAVATRRGAPERGTCYATPIVPRVLVAAALITIMLLTTWVVLWLLSDLPEDRLHVTLSAANSWFDSTGLS